MFFILCLQKNEMFCLAAQCYQKAQYACSECHRAYYCSPEHQAAHWFAEHHAVCRHRILSGAPKRSRHTLEDDYEDDETSTHVQKQPRETCPRDLESEQRETFQDALGDIPDEEVRNLEHDADINRSCKSIVDNTTTLSNLCKDFMELPQIEAVMMKIHDARINKTDLDKEWQLPELFRALTQYHEAYFRLLLQDEPTTEASARVYTAHVSSLTDDFVEFYKIFCPYITHFAQGDTEGRESLLERVRTNISKIDVRINEIEMGSGILSLPGRALRGIYNVICYASKVFCGKMIAIVLALITITPYQWILASEMTNEFVLSLQNVGYYIPKEYFDMRQENFMGLTSTASHVFSWVNSGNANPWIQTGINATFRIFIIAMNISNTLKALLAHGFSFFCSQLLQRMGLGAFAAAVSSSFAAHVFVAAVIFFSWKGYAWYKRYRSNRQLREELVVIGTKFRQIVTTASVRAKQ